MTIYHLAEPRHWEQAQASGSYTMSTLGRTLAQEGFIHCSSAEQWPVVRRAFYADHPNPLLLLEIDESRLFEPPVIEVGNPNTGETFPHLYRPLPIDAVVRVTELAPPRGVTGAAGPVTPLTSRCRAWLSRHAMKTLQRRADHVGVVCVRDGPRDPNM